MAKEIAYPAIEKIIEYNALALALLRVKKADKPEVMSRQKIRDAIGQCMDSKEDIHGKAAILLACLTKGHAFASGNRRTAFLVAKDFLLSNGAKLEVKDDPSYAPVLKGVREGFYTHEEIREWLKNGKIRAFKR
ncbi:MAG TPA: Fic family protein [Candidatus Nanoarchaeia archaeon]|nr:Fic family protein [Candidatus Nanoarchaeia archaeon]